MSTNSETKFPSTETYGEYEWLFNDINDWFKRCIEDLPFGRDTTHGTNKIVWAVGWLHLIPQWFEKWFSQFMEKDEGGE